MVVSELVVSALVSQSETITKYHKPTAKVRWRVSIGFGECLWFLWHFLFLHFMVSRGGSCSRGVCDPVRVINAVFDRRQQFSSVKDRQNKHTGSQTPREQEYIWGKYLIKQAVLHSNIGYLVVLRA